MQEYLLFPTAHLKPRSLFNNRALCKSLFKGFFRWNRNTSNSTIHVLSAFQCCILVGLCLLVPPCLLVPSSKHCGEAGRTTESHMAVTRGKKKITTPGLAKLLEMHDNLILKHFIEIWNLIAFRVAYNLPVFYRYVTIVIRANIYSER